jgi:hypothetical protein
MKQESLSRKDVADGSGDIAEGYVSKIISGKVEYRQAEGSG